MGDASDIFYFLFSSGAGKRKEASGRWRGVVILLKIEGGYPRRSRGGGGTGAARMSARRRGGAKYFFFSGPKCPPSLFTITDSLFKLSAYKMGVSMRLFKLRVLSLFKLPFSISGENRSLNHV